MNPISNLVFVLLLTVFPSQILCQSTLIDQACLYTIHPFVCLDTLIQDPISKNATTLKEIATILLNHTGIKASEVGTEIITRNSSATDEGLKKALTSCSHFYVTVVEKLQAAGTSLADGNIDQVKTLMTDATINRQNCDKVFLGKPFESPMSISTIRLSEMQGNAESIISHL